MEQLQMSKIDWARVYRGLHILTTPHPAFNNHAPCPILGQGLSNGKITVTQGHNPIQDAKDSKDFVKRNKLWGHCYIYEESVDKDTLEVICETFEDKDTLFLYMHPTNPQRTPINISQPYPMLIIQRKDHLKSVRKQIVGYPYDPEIDIE